MNQTSIELPDDIIRNAKRMTGRRTARAAVLAALDAFNVDKALPRHLPRNAQDAAKTERRARRFDNAEEAVKFMKAL